MIENIMFVVLSVSPFKFSKFSFLSLQFQNELWIFANSL